MQTNTTYIALGSNMGDRRALIQQALKMIAQTEGVEILSTSHIIETAPLVVNTCLQDVCNSDACSGAGGDYLNSVCGITCELTPETLLAKLQYIENSLGRKRPYKWAPRTIDIDILLYGSEVINTEALKIPHPLMHERMFVMGPMAEIAPKIKHPVLGKSMREICQILENNTTGIYTHRI